MNICSKTLFRFFIGLLLSGMLCLSSCRKDKIDTSKEAKLDFSNDSVSFDTVFARLNTGATPKSITRTLIIYNNNKNDVESDIFLAGGAQSVFRINIDGIPHSSVSKYRIPGKDSILLFVQVTPNASMQNLPLIVEDSLIFTTNGNIQKVHLLAWGQDAYYLYDSVLTCNAIWSDTQKPYVLYNSVLVPKGCKLTIDKGVKVFNHVNSTIFVQGTLEIKGTATEPVIIQGDRLEKYMQDIPNQWWGIRLLPGSINNNIQHTIIKNGVVGIEIDSLPANNNPNLTISHTVVQTMASVCISSYTAKVKATNCLFANAGQVVFYGELGGSYELLHCTIVNSKCIFSSPKPALYFSNADYVEKDANGTVIRTIINNLGFSIVNCIVFGGNDDEFVVYDGGRPSNIGPTIIDHCLLKTKITTLNINNNLINQDPKFKSACKYDYTLDTLSPAINKAIPTLVTDDLKGNLRDNTPCMGAYERN